VNFSAKPVRKISSSLSTHDGFARVALSSLNSNVRFIVNRDLIFPPRTDAKGGRRRVESSFEDLLERAEIEDFRFHDLRHTFESWYMMNGGDLYELAKILGHANIKMTERYAKLARQHIARTSSTARVMWNLLEPACKTANVG